MAILRPCLDCGVLAGGSYCPVCARQRDRRRGSTVQRLGSGWAAVSRRVILRDGGLCHICGLAGADTADHLLPRSLGSDSSDVEQLAAAHRSCTSRRGARVA